MVRLLIVLTILGLWSVSCASSPHQDDGAWESVAMTYGPMKKYFQMRAYQQGRLPYLPPSVFEEDRADKPNVEPIWIEDYWGMPRKVYVPADPY